MNRDEYNTLSLAVIDLAHQYCKKDSGIGHGKNWVSTTEFDSCVSRAIREIGEGPHDQQKNLIVIDDIVVLATTNGELRIVRVTSTTPNSFTGIYLGRKTESKTPVYSGWQLKNCIVGTKLNGTWTENM